MEGLKAVFVYLANVRKRIRERIDSHLNKYRSQYVFGFALLVLILMYTSKSGPQLCMVNNFNPSEPILKNVSLYHIFSRDPRIRHWFAHESGHEVHIATGDFGTRLEVQGWRRNGATGGSYAELSGEALCWDSDCPPVMSSGDYVGIPTKFTSASKVVVMYTIFLLPTLEDRARGCVFSNITNFRSTRVKALWGEVIVHFCTWLYVFLGMVMVAIVVSVRDALKLNSRSSLYSSTEQQDQTQGQHQAPLEDQDCQLKRVGVSPSTELDVAGSSNTPQQQHTTDAGTSRLTSLPDDSSSSTNSLVSAVSENEKNGTFRMVGPHLSGIPYTKLGASSDSSTPSEQHVTSDSSSDDDRDPSSNIQEESTTDIPLARFARYRKNAVYENFAGGAGVLRPSPEGSGFGV